MKITKTAVGREQVNRLVNAVKRLVGDYRNWERDIVYGANDFYAVYRKGKVVVEERYEHPWILTLTITLSR